MVMTVPTVCMTTVPGYWGSSVQSGAGFFLNQNVSTTYYFYDGSTASFPANWPTHDPCGTNAPNQIDNAPNPHGQLWIRHR